ncbi:MAG: histidine--tRNA ligase [Candidatus Omnitrophota bacterium]
MVRRIPGTKDTLPEETYLWQKIEEISRNIFSTYNYSEIRPPIIEDAALFNRSLGEWTEIVQKQMFLIKHLQDLYALRPEGTASVVRAYIENNLDKTRGFAKFYYIGPMFRLERPQKGRLRQFHHIGTEVIGSTGPEIDIEVISLADSLLKALLIENYEIKINTLGCTKDKTELNRVLREELKDKLSILCPDCNHRFEHNTLRILDCKNQACKEVIEKLDIQDKYLCQDCGVHFAKIKQGLDILGVKYEVCPQLVRGLDYYTRTVFEIKHPGLGAQDAIGAGGRYDNLIKELDGPDIGAIGFAFGIERILLAVSRQLPETDKNLVYIISLGEQAKQENLKMIACLRKAGISSDTDYENKSLKGAMRKASDLGAKYVLIIGEDELKKNTVTLKDMGSGEQKEVSRENILEEIKKVNS